MSTTNGKTTTPRTTTPRLRAPRRQRAESIITADSPRYVTLGEGSRFEFALVTFAMVAIWVSFFAAIVAL